MTNKTSKKEITCKVWEIDNPNVSWYETFFVDKDKPLYQLRRIFKAFNFHRRPTENQRDFTCECCDMCQYDKLEKECAECNISYIDKPLSVSHHQKTP